MIECEIYSNSECCNKQEKKLSGVVAPPSWSSSFYFLLFILFYSIISWPSPPPFHNMQLVFFYILFYLSSLHAQEIGWWTAIDAPFWVGWEIGSFGNCNTALDALSPGMSFQFFPGGGGYEILTDFLGGGWYEKNKMLCAKTQKNHYFTKSGEGG